MMNHLLKPIILITLLIQSLYSSEPSTATRIPVHSYPFLSRQKFIKFQIEGRPYLALIDTGSSLSLIRSDVFSKIDNKEHVSDSECINLYGDSSSSPNFEVQGVKLGEYSFGATFKEEDTDFILSCGIFNPLLHWKSHLMYRVFREAIIGMNIFQKFACIFDFPHASLFIADEMGKIIDHENFDTAPFYTVPFEMGRGGPILQFETQLGTKKFLLDAGSTLSILRFSDQEKLDHPKKSTYKTALTLGGIDFGKWSFKVIDFTSKFDDFDGLLGIDFFNENIICFDFSKQIAHIQHPKLGSKERFNYWLKSYFGK